MTDVLKVQGEPDYRFAIAAAVDGAEAVADGGDERTLRLRIPAGKFVAWIALAATRDKAADVAVLARQRLAALQTRGLEDLRKAHVAWWSQFWAKSFIKLTSADGVADYCANLWYMHLYAMAAGSRGEVPPKFNGGLWTDQPRRAGVGAGLLALEHPGVLLADLRRQSPGAAPALPGHVLADAAGGQEVDQGDLGVRRRAVPGDDPLQRRDGRLGQGTRRPSATARAAARRPHQPDPLVVGRDRHAVLVGVPLHGRRGIPARAGLPDDEGDGRLLRELPGAGRPGPLQHVPSNAHETFWKVKNPATRPGGAAVLLPDDHRGQSAAERRRRPAGRLAGPPANTWRRIRIDPQTGAILPYEPRPGEKIEVTNAENPELFPVGVFPLITLGSPDYELAVKTFRAGGTSTATAGRPTASARPGWGWRNRAPTRRRGRHWGLQQLLPLHAEYYQDHPSGLQDYYGRKPAIHPYLEGSGTMATAVGEMLLQSWDDVIRVCPALPKAWSADFKLLAMGGFEVSGHAENGRVAAVSLLSQRGQKVRMVNPLGAAAVVTCGDQEVLRADGPMLEFPTEAGKTYFVARADAPPVMPEVTAQPNNAPKRLAPHQQPLDRQAGDGLAQLASAGRARCPASAGGRPDRASGAARVQAGSPAGRAEDRRRPGGRGVEAGPSCRPAVATRQEHAGREQTEVLVGYDDQALYFGITCWESRMDGLLVEYAAGPASRDAPVVDDDSVEIFLEPAPGRVWHFAVNALGAILDAVGSTAENEDRAANPAWQVAVSRRSNRWIVEAAIPFASLARRPAAARRGVGLQRRPQRASARRDQHLVAAGWAGPFSAEPVRPARLPRGRAFTRRKRSRPSTWSHIGPSRNSKESGSATSPATVTTG